MYLHSVGTQWANGFNHCRSRDTWDFNGISMGFQFSKFKLGQLGRDAKFASPRMIVQSLQTRNIWTADN
ncbi:MAG TPA: hypothetical protein PLY70_16285 [Saprospiraceae bacterium]|nr:hypothetical protein [Saprospiraceae bacterium]